MIYSNESLCKKKNRFCPWWADCLVEWTENAASCPYCPSLVLMYIHVCVCTYIYMYIHMSLCSMTQRCHLIFISKLAFLCGSAGFAPEFQAVIVHSQDNQVCLVENNISITCLHLQKDSFQELHALLLVQCRSFVWIIPAWCCYFAMHISVLYVLDSFYCSFLFSSWSLLSRSFWSF